MENLAYIGLSRQVALLRQMDVTANNLANINTPGFKSQHMLFTEYLNRAGGNSPENQTVQVDTYATYRDNSQGTLHQTFNPLDVAIQGEGFFKVKTPEGTKYTRAGSFSLNENREIVNKDGFALLGDGAAEIKIPEDATDFSIAEDGSISSKGEQIGKFAVVTFANLNNVVPAGDNLYQSISDKEKSVENPHVEQGMLETSNVQPILEMSRMIEIQRMFQATQNMLNMDHDRQRNVIQKLTKSLGLEKER